MAFSYQLLLNGLICREQDDDPEITEHDEIYFVTTTIEPDGNFPKARADVFPSDKEIEITENESIANSNDPDLTRWKGAVISSGVFPQRVILNVFMLEFDGGVVADVMKAVTGSISQVPVLSPDLFDVSQLPQLGAKVLSPILAAATTDPLLGSFTVQLTNGATPDIKWIPGTGLNQLPGWPYEGNGIEAAWSFVNYSQANYEAAYKLSFGN
jgi:hypothetical protein